MAKQTPFMDACSRTIAETEAALQSDKSNWSDVYRQYKLVESCWFRAIDESSEESSRRMEDLCCKLELTVIKCEDWMKTHENEAPSKQALNDEQQESNQEIGE